MNTALCIDVELQTMLMFADRCTDEQGQRQTDEPETRRPLLNQLIMGAIKNSSN